ncbi:hypothetical protein GQ55_4G126900 [Panicum hallii var. hallii]|uniref:PLAT domain-containing protein n=1 Tax=Panicum hallii var. hallii TaxID=1504633 RepID=A0A2T7DXZ6_9POAL|nr:hypothetical protein GQ55_4G126800 [Panicum hallii var. hallii]PUZ60439.1 hypothetical protein GQ55_4G126900 [Panicum hallii var. hallii]
MDALAMDKISIILVLLASSYGAVLQGHARPVLSSDNALLQRNDDETASVGATRNFTYLFEVQTGDMRLAGTDSQLTFTFSDTDSNSFELVYDGSGEIYQQFFERGQYNYDEFTKDIFMKPCRLKIKTDGRGAAPSWYCEWVKISVWGQRFEEHYEHRFIVQHWIGPNDPDPSELTVNDCNKASMASAKKNMPSSFSII